MPRDRIFATYLGEQGEFHMGLPARDILESEFDAFDDDQKATLAASPIYELHHEAPKEARAAERRVEREAAAPAPPPASVMPAAPADAAAPKAAEKK